MMHQAIAAAGIPLVGVESSDALAFVLHFGEAATTEQRVQAHAIAEQISAASTPDYQRFKDLLRGGGLFALALGTNDSKAWTVLLSAIESNAPDHDFYRIQDFQWALFQVVAGLPVALTPEQTQQLNGILTECGFGFQLA